MIAGRLTKVAGIALVVCLATALPVAAQITTGSMAGTVKDAQGGGHSRRDHHAHQRNQRHEVAADRHERNR